MPYLGLLGHNFRKLLSYLKQQRQICQLGTFRKNLKVYKFGTKKALLGHFWDGILKRLLRYLKSAPSNLSNSKAAPKKKTRKV